MERVSLSPRAYSQVTLAALLALAFIVVTGAAVRLTGSGLGCPDWPTCDGSRLVAPLEYHAMIEFINRTVTGLVSVAVMLAVLGSCVRKPRRRDLVWLSAGLVGGVLAQIVLGGLVVRFHLAPPLVMGHFVVSMLLLLDATVLHHRAGLPDGARSQPAAPTNVVALTRMLVVSAAIVIGLGTVVTGTGPHAGSHDGELVERLAFDLRDVARLHGAAVLLFIALLLFTVRELHRARVSPELLRKAEALLAVVVAQAVVGYTQYFTGVPPLLVAIHVAGSVAVWIATLRLVLALHVRVSLPAVAMEPV